MADATDSGKPVSYVSNEDGKQLSDPEQRN